MFKERSATSLAALFCGLAIPTAVWADGPPSFETLDRQYQNTIQPAIKQFCIRCHSTQKHKGDFDLRLYKAVGDFRRDSQVWLKLADASTAERCRPRGVSSPQPRCGRFCAVGRALPGRGGRSEPWRPRAGRDPPADQRGVQQFRLRPHGHQARTSARVSGGRGGRRGIHERQRCAGDVPSCLTSTWPRPRESPRTRFSCRKDSGSPKR